MRNLYRQRAAFETDLFTELTPLLKKSNWKKKSCAFFGKSGAFYQDVFVSVHRNTFLTRAELRFKPMALDPILWEIMGIPENMDMPLSFRTWGAFTCSALPIYEAQLEESGNSAREVAGKLVDLCNNRAMFYQERLASASFSQLIAEHPNQTERGAYAETLVSSLINDGDLDLAYHTANAYASGELASCATFTSGGKSFHQLALEWLDGPTRPKSVLCKALN